MNATQAASVTERATIISTVRGSTRPVRRERRNYFDSSVGKSRVYKEGGVTFVDTIQVLMRDEKKEERSK